MKGSAESPDVKEHPFGLNVDCDRGGGRFWIVWLARTVASGQYQDNQPRDDSPSKKPGAK
jgi:hypothetical protein